MMNQQRDHVVCINIYDTGIDSFSISLSSLGSIQEKVHESRSYFHIFKKKQLH